MPVHITEHSFTHNTAIYHGGRGGAGNYRKLSPSELILSKTTSPTPTPTHSSSKVFFGGRGGAGNVHPTSERAMFSFDEELERDRIFHEHHAPVYSIGRGGVGNLVPSDEISTRSFYSNNSSTSSSPRSSTSSNGPVGSHFSRESIKSGADKLWERMRRH